jgi:hypothetical protein
VVPCSVWNSVRSQGSERSPVETPEPRCLGRQISALPISAESSEVRALPPVALKLDGWICTASTIEVDATEPPRSPSLGYRLEPSVKVRGRQGGNIGPE